MANSSLPCTLIGGGLAGGLLAVYLARAGCDVDLFEMRPDPASGNVVRGRSINLAISVRGLHALSEVGLADSILTMAVPMRGRMIHALDGGLHFQPYDKDPAKCINSISRADLNTSLLEAAKACPNARVHFDWKCVDVDVDRPAARLVHADTGQERVTESPVVIGIDGAWSSVRRSMQRLPRFNYSQHYLRHGYKELCIPAKAGGGFAMEANALHIWPRRSYMMIALPNADGSFTCTLFFPHEGPESFAALKSRDDVKRFFDREFPDAVPLMPTLLDDFETNPIGAMATIRCAPWSHAGNVALVGDAAHAVVPFYGQGANASFEDCVALHAAVKRHGGDWSRVFEDYETARRENADAIADLAIQNFLEMRDKTASRTFHIKKKSRTHAAQTAAGNLHAALHDGLVFDDSLCTGREEARKQTNTTILAAWLIVVAISTAFSSLLGGWFWMIGGAMIIIAVAAIALTGEIKQRDNHEARQSGAKLMT